ncbi:DUF2062 domain-containing protein [Aureibaculum marinum]|uniref:DUF2062 domain-containing protein n=1 Tax=Aureibaculum marinum TaxID=2487930 RepID=A0A3N4P1Z7_9FLAO|nr:DUF2062 domain-containing protein [Aureibaculum marinum]RPD98600.1 DUF2062 domain-containing protein [Aureibaculum marinum]
MQNPEEIIQKISDYNCCVVVPTYNNDTTLERVIQGVLRYTKNIIVINDGSIDNTKNILLKYPEITQINLKNNVGKGNALRLGLKRAEELNFEYAISIDSDGQHYPDDIPLFIKEFDTSLNKKILFIGARNLNAKGMPRKNSFANKFSNFWYWAETGFTLQDTQSGFRMYPVKEINKIKFLSTKFEFEVEVIVKASWNGIEVRNIPIRVLYDSDERVSHYRPFMDFIRISAMNTWLFTVAIIYIKPRDFYRRFKQKGFKKFFYEDLIGSRDSNLKKALSIALGTFIGISPFWGFHSILAIMLAAIFKLNKVISFVFSNVSFPIFIPFIIYGSLKMGGSILGRTSLELNQIDENFKIGVYLVQYVVGSFVLAFLTAILFGTIGYITLHLFSSKNSK